MTAGFIVPFISPAFSAVTIARPAFIRLLCRSSSACIAAPRASAVSGQSSAQGAISFQKIA